MGNKKLRRKILLAFAVIFVMVNGIAAMHAYKFTHYADGGKKTKEQDLTIGDKILLLLTGIENPRPVNSVFPDRPYKTVYIDSNVPLECWYMPAGDSAKGTVALFHGFTGDKSKLLERAGIFLNNGYNCLLVDFMGSGGSGGSSTTIGYKEADEVRDCYNYLKSMGEPHIFLYGSSMGAVAIMKAVQDTAVSPAAIVIDCPFGTMYQTVCARFRMLHVPVVPMAGLLMFWGGVENGFWAFGHNPEQYAANIHCPALLQYGEADDRVTRGEIDAIYENLAGPRQLATYPNVGHDDYLKKSSIEWSRNVLGFFGKYATLTQPD